MADGQTRGRKRRLNGEINVVPYIDVMLVLLIIFMVTAPLLTQGVNVELPKASAKPLAEQSREPLIVSIDRAGLLYASAGGNPKSPIEASELARRVKIVVERDAATPILLKADRAVAYGRVVKVLALLDAAGAPRIGFITEPEEAGRRAAR
jgi:biopolymer transport protein TolR